MEGRILKAKEQDRGMRGGRRWVTWRSPVSVPWTLCRDLSAENEDR